MAKCEYAVTHLPGRGREQPVEAKIGALAGTVVSLLSDSETLQIDLHGADFNGDARPRSSSHGAYLVCEFHNGGGKFVVSRVSEEYDARDRYITRDGTRRTLAFSDLDADVTVRVNQERGTPLQLPR